MEIAKEIYYCEQVKLMIKFIATDLDGTLLDSKKNLPKGFGKMIDELNSRGVIFAPASGRQYYTVEAQFKELGRELMYIAENGAMIVDKGEVVSCDCIEPETAKDIIVRVRDIPTASAILCCLDSAFGEDNSDPNFEYNTRMYYKRFKFVDDLTKLCDAKKILKIAIFDNQNPYENVKKVLPEYEGEAEVVISGANWADIMKPGISKGTAIKRVREIYGFKREECMCFGDYMNDYEMILECGESYAMGNAIDEIKDAAKHIAPSNDENGVMCVLEELIKRIKYKE